MKPSEQQWNPEQYAENARFVSDLGMPVVELLAPQPGERILDLGCGDGALTIRLLDCGCEVVAIDASAEMIAAAQALGLNARVTDARMLDFDREFDAVFSNAALHWMDSPAKVIRGVWRALRPGGRFVGEFGGYGNVASITRALESALRSRGLRVPEPWYFPRPKDYAELLTGEGFRVDRIELIPRPTALPGDISAWLKTFTQPYTAVVPETERRKFLAEIRSSLESVLCDAKGCWHVDYVRLRFSAHRPPPEK